MWERQKTAKTDSENLTHEPTWPPFLVPEHPTSNGRYRLEAVEPMVTSPPSIPLNNDQKAVIWARKTCSICHLHSPWFHWFWVTPPTGFRSSGHYLHFLTTHITKNSWFAANWPPKCSRLWELNPVPPSPPLDSTRHEASIPTFPITTIWI